MMLRYSNLRQAWRSSAMVASTVKAANDENAKFQEEVLAMAQALKNSEQDYQNVIDELEAVKVEEGSSRVVHSIVVKKVDGCQH